MDTRCFELCGERELSPRRTFDCGQCFRWNEGGDGKYRGVASGRAAVVWTEGGSAWIECAPGDIDFWREYLDMETDYEAARHIEPVEEVVDDLVATLRANHIRRVRDGQCTVYAGLTFLDILVNVERIADQCSNVGVFTLSMFDEHIMNNHHDYIQALHQGKDPVFNRAYQEAHDKYFGELKRIERSK